MEMEWRRLEKQQPSRAVELVLGKRTKEIYIAKRSSKCRSNIKGEGSNHVSHMGVLVRQVKSLQL